LRRIAWLVGNRISWHSSGRTRLVGYRLLPIPTTHGERDTLTQRGHRVRAADHERPSSGSAIDRLWGRQRSRSPPRPGPDPRARPSHLSDRRHSPVFRSTRVLVSHKSHPSQSHTPTFSSWAGGKMVLLFFKPSPVRRHALAVTRDRDLLDITTIGRQGRRAGECNSPGAAAHDY
jgi:hypothetical protein